jgi:VanZ family protein
MIGWIKDYRLFRFLSIGWMALIFLLSSQSELPAPSLFWGQDKVAHFVAFGVLAFLLAHSLGPWEGKLTLREALFVTLMVAIYGVFDESHQMFVPGRDPSLGDLAADVLGGFLVAVSYLRRLGHR